MSDIQNVDVTYSNKAREMELQKAQASVLPRLHILASFIIVWKLTV